MGRIFAFTKQIQKHFFQDRYRWWNTNPALGSWYKTAVHHSKAVLAGLHVTWDNNLWGCIHCCTSDIKRSHYKQFTHLNYINIINVKKNIMYCTIWSIYVITRMRTFPLILIVKLCLTNVISPPGTSFPFFLNPTVPVSQSSVNNHILQASKLSCFGNILLWHVAL